MNSVFIISIAICLILFIFISVKDYKNIGNLSDYIAAGKSQSFTAVTLTLLATTIGASTTIGISDTVYSIGFPGIWWLAFGAVDLILQSFILSEKVKAIDADTLPDLAKKTVGSSAEMILSLIIVISWIGVIAGQLSAMNSLISFALGRESKVISIIVTVIIILYTVSGGQLSVVNTDRLQFIIIILGIVTCFIYLYFFQGSANAEIFNNIELLNKDYTPINLLTQLFVIGGVYFLGPDIMSRNFISKDKKTARTSAFAAGIGLFIFSILITFIGMWAKYNIPVEEKKIGTLFTVINILPKPVAILLTLGLLSAILSSTDTCIINAAGIFTKDVLRKDSIPLARISVAVLGIISGVLCFSGSGNIMTLLTGAYSIYTPGIIFPLTIAILCYKKRNINKKIWIAAVILGGLFGITGTYLIQIKAVGALLQPVSPYLSLIGMGVSLIISLCSVREQIH